MTWNRVATIIGLGAASFVAPVLPASAQNPADMPQGTAGAACAGPAWTYYVNCPLEKLPATTSSSGPATIAGDLTVERPTLIALGFDWRITGDANRNSAVAVAYRKSGSSAWRTGLPLLRLMNEQLTFGVPPLKYAIPNMFSGSIFDLEPDTEYEVRLTLSDPDGVTGEAVRTVTTRTRKDPKPASGGKVYHVYPWGYKGQKQEPAFTGLNAAYYLEGGRPADWANVSAPRVQPGDTLLIHAGVYKDEREIYGWRADRSTLGNIFDGTFYLTQSGTPEKPIVIKAAGDGEVIFDGDGNFNLFNLTAGNYHYFEGITVRNTEIGFLLGVKNILGSSGFTLKKSRVENTGRSIWGEWSGSKDFTIVDNVFIGRHDPTRLLGWGRGGPFEKLPGYPERITGPTGSEYAVKVYGQGHVVAYNLVEHFHDGIDVGTYGDPDGAPDEFADRIPVSMDIYNNDIFSMGDNCIEGDGGARNIRVLRNRCFNSAGGALSAQTSYGGPMYFIRNVVVQGLGNVLKYSIMPAGIVNYHNTYLSASNGTNLASNVHFRNNLMLSHSDQGRAFSIQTFTAYSSSDYNGFRPGPGMKEPFAWDGPPPGAMTHYVPGPVPDPCGAVPYSCSPTSTLTRNSYRSLADFTAATGQDRHSMLIDYDVFVKAPIPNNPDVQHLYKREDYDLQLKRRAKPIDAGVVLPGINDGFSGRAPDLGAYEYGQPLPHYGPRN